ncbi:MAG: hypothetical protein P1U86_05690 [Verrucomicrobiales bacterium]|nr:hypothetical protein [Verrucomicrobiales bacterium]
MKELSLPIFIACISASVLFQSVGLSQSADWGKRWPGAVSAFADTSKDMLKPNPDDYPFNGMVTFEGIVKRVEMRLGHAVAHFQITGNGPEWPAGVAPGTLPSGKKIDFTLSVPKKVGKLFAEVSETILIFDPVSGSLKAVEFGMMQIHKGGDLTPGKLARLYKPFYPRSDAPDQWKLIHTSIPRGTLFPISTGVTKEFVTIDASILNKMWLGILGSGIPLYVQSQTYITPKGWTVFLFVGSNGSDGEIKSTPVRSVAASELFD